MGDKLTRPPQGFPADYPDIDLLKYKNYVVGHNLEDSVITGEGLADQLIEIYTALYPFNSFIYRALTDV